MKILNTEDKSMQEGLALIWFRNSLKFTVWSCEFTSWLPYENFNQSNSGVIPINQLWPLVALAMIAAKMIKRKSAPAQKDSDLLSQTDLILISPQPWLLHHPGLLGRRDGGHRGCDHVQVHHAQQQGAHQGGHLQVGDPCLASFQSSRVGWL